MGVSIESKSPPSDDQQVKAEETFSETDHANNLDEKTKVSDFKADAIEAENAEHNMGVLEAVQAYPAASFWAFVMSFTIVSYPPHFLCNRLLRDQLTTCRLWNPTMSS